MKKVVLSIALPALLFAGAQAQTPTMDFESWANSGTYDEPTGWATLNILSNVFLGGNPVSVFKDGTNPHGGSYSMKLTSVALTSNPDPQNIPDTIGMAFTGSINVAQGALQFGYPYTARPQTFSWWGRYTTGNSPDSAFAFAALTHWNGAGRDTIAMAGNVLNTNYPSWTNFATSFFYNPLFPNTQPDSMIIIYSACDQTVGHPGNSLWVDDITFTGYVGVNETTVSETISLFPNPSNGPVFIELGVDMTGTIAVYDASGREVSSMGISGRKTQVADGAMEPGFYSYIISDRNGLVISKGKFVISE